MEFKGTKGEWEITNTPWNDEFYIRSLENNEFIANLMKTHNRDANALLISKAPEMLDMLNDIKDYLGSDKRQEVEQLIKEATEL